MGTTQLEQPESIATFFEAVEEHRQVQSEMLESIEPDLAQQIALTSRHVRASLGIGDAAMTVLFGSMPYGLGRQAGLEKKLLARAVQSYAGAVPVEILASDDTAEDAKTISLPMPQRESGILTVTMIPRWSKVARLAMSAIPSPSTEHLLTVGRDIRGIYPRDFASGLLQRVSAAYETNPASHADANARIQREFEAALGLACERVYAGSQLDTLIARSGGLEVMLTLWPRFTAVAKQYPVEGTRVPEHTEAPFHVNHEGCGGRMTVVANLSEGQRVIQMDTPLTAACAHCNHRESFTAGDVLASGRLLTFRAMARVAAYSVFGIGNGYITGGGSAYDAPVQHALREMGLPFFPQINMSRVDATGQRSTVIQYVSAATFRSSARRLAGYEKAVELVRSGGASVADLEVSVRADVLRAAIEAALEDPGSFRRDTRIHIHFDGRQSEGVLAKP